MISDLGRSLDHDCAMLLLYPRLLHLESIRIMCVLYICLLKGEDGYRVFYFPVRHSIVENMLQE